MYAQENLKRKKVLGATLLIHIAIIAVALTSYVTVKVDSNDIKDFYDNYVAISFSNTSSSSGSASTSKNVKPEPKKEATARAIKDEMIKADPLEEADSPVKTTKDNTTKSNKNESTEATSKSEGEGNTGKLLTGRALGEMEFDGIGIFGRKVIYMPPVQKLAEKTGVITVNMAVNRAGKVVAVALNDKSTTINDKKLINKMLNMSAYFRFEADYSAPPVQYCKYVFIFEIYK